MGRGSPRGGTSFEFGHPFRLGLFGLASSLDGPRKPPIAGEFGRSCLFYQAKAPVIVPDPCYPVDTARRCRRGVRGAPRAKLSVIRSGALPVRPITRRCRTRRIPALAVRERFFGLPLQRVPYFLSLSGRLGNLGRRSSRCPMCREGVSSEREAARIPGSESCEDSDVVRWA